MNDEPTTWQLLGVAALHLLIVVVICTIVEIPALSEFFSHLF